MSILDEAAEVVGQAEDPIIVAVERLVKNAYRSGRRDALAEVEALVKATLVAWRNDHAFASFTWNKDVSPLTILAGIKKMPR